MEEIENEMICWFFSFQPVIMNKYRSNLSIACDAWVMSIEIQIGEKSRTMIKKRYFLLKRVLILVSQHRY